MKPLWRDTYNVLGSNGCTKQYNVVVAGQEMGDTTGGVCHRPRWFSLQSTESNLAT